jgi:ribonuclease G
MSGDARILVETSPGQSRALYLIDGKVVEGWHDFHHDPDLTGRVYQARINRVFPAQNRATAMLENGTAISVRTTRHDRLQAGESATVTIVAAPREAKPWQAVTGARLAGKNVVLLPGGEGIARSQRMVQPPAAQAMKALQSMIQGTPGFGVILRRHAGESEDLAGEAATLVAAWRAGLRDVEGTGCLFDNGGLAARIAVQEPHLPQDPVEPDGAGDFDMLWDAMIDESTRPDIPLVGGGVMWVEPTRALTAIDLDSGSDDLALLFTAAPQAIARQLRLRQIGGLVAVDVPRASPLARRTFDEALDSALARDPRSPERIGRSRGGLVEIRIAHGRPGPAMWAADRVAVDALAALRTISLRPKLASPRLECRPNTADWLRGPGAAALASLDRTVGLVVSSEAIAATLIEAPG